jgi:hypothetical protein
MTDHALWIPLTVGLALDLLLPVEGVIAAWQSAHVMHGFARQDDEPKAEWQHGRAVEGGR